MLVKKLKITVVDANDQLVEVDFEGRIDVRYSIHYDIERINAIKPSLAHTGAFSISLNASGQDISLYEEGLKAHEEANA